MTTELTKEQQMEIVTPGVWRIMDALHHGGFEARVVGGAVRDLLLGRKIGDIDLAANAPPEQVVENLAREKIKTVPTGIDHGTVTAVIDHVGYEVTALRLDVATDGRHAQVAYTDDWQADAARRDFTMNALYVNAFGEIFDYFGGAEDAKAGRVRFIGDASARIEEDVLRILRFFRFYAQVGKGEADAEALAACRSLAHLMPRLSAERVAKEVLKLLAAPNPVPAWRLMIDSGVVKHFLAEASDVARLEKLLAAEKQYKESPAPLVRLAALLPQDKKIAAQLGARLKFSNRDAETLAILATLPGLLRDLAPAALRRLLYQYGAENVHAALFLTEKDIAQALATIAAWQNPVFPLKGEDIVALGIPAGPRVGEILRALEEEWIAGDFRATRAACLAQAGQYGKNH